MAERSTMQDRIRGQGPTLSVIVPTYNSAALTQKCLSALVASISHRQDAEIIVSDDGSTDGTGELLEMSRDRVTLVRSEINRGFAAACNAGAKAARGRWLIFYNNDLTPHGGWIDELVDYVTQVPDAAIVGCKLLMPDGRLQHAGVVLCSDGYPRHVYAGFPANHPLVNKSGPAHMVTGACMLVASKWFDRMTGFDEKYRNGYEDIDLCLRVGAARGEVHYCHRSVLTHLVSATRLERVEEFAGTQRRFLDMWGHLPPDDLSRYIQDGLINLEYTETYPFRIQISPLLGIYDRDAGGLDAYSSLTEQLYEARRMNMRLSLQIAEMEHAAPSA
jgi:GT2 family glycosyltransferase